MPPPGPRPPRVEDGDQAWADKEDDDAGAGPRNPVRRSQAATRWVDKRRAANRGRGTRRGTNQGIAMTGGTGATASAARQVLVGQRDDVAKPSDDWVPPRIGEPQIQHVESEEEFMTPSGDSGASSSGLQPGSSSGLLPPLPPPVTIVGSIPAGARVPVPRRVGAARTDRQSRLNRNLSSASQINLVPDRGANQRNARSNQQQQSEPRALQPSIINAARQWIARLTTPSQQALQPAQSSEDVMSMGQHELLHFISRNQQ